MKEIKKVVKQGFENEFESLMAKKSTINSEKEEAIQKAIFEVEERFKERETLIENLLSMISDEVEVETPDPEVEDSESEVEITEDDQLSGESGNTEEEVEVESNQEEAVEIDRAQEAEPEVQPGVAIDPYRLRI